ncbi:hypothetical protein [Amycolatopsis sp. lyj-90]|uniref:hypothetical protein n=1 Tax=Amycolatopsis sp. lyj-90 TaxID=2789285 RepID=UPI0039799C86
MVATIGMTGVDAPAELDASAKVLVVARVEHLGYAGSGHGAILYLDAPGWVRFARASTDEGDRRPAHAPDRRTRARYAAAFTRF